MDDLECPNCHQKTIPLWRKMFLGPATSVKCAKCGARVSVPYSAMLAVIPFLIAIVAAQFVGSIVLAGALLVVAVLVMCWIHYKFVPLIVKT
jgi:ribosomal protein S27E